MRMEKIVGMYWAATNGRIRVVERDKKFNGI